MKHTNNHKRGVGGRSEKDFNLGRGGGEGSQTDI